MLQSFLFKIKDHRRQQGRRYQLGHILPFSVLAILSNATSYDAINCQEKTLEVAKKTGNDVIVQVKGNQKTLFEDCKSMASTLPPAEAYQEPTAKGHNRIECRSVELFTLPYIPRC